MNKMNKLMVASLLGLSVFGSMLYTSALAAPQDKKPAQKGGKKPATKAPAKTAGDAVAGKKIYEAQGCAGCHAISGNGGMVGPELTKVGADAKHTTKWLTDYVSNPKAIKADSTMPAYGDKIKGKDMTNLVAYLASLK